MFWWIVIGIVGGVFGGMGMGGGTLLIPLITTILGLEQKSAQLINLVSFVIMAGFVLIMHFKNKLVNIRVGTIFAIFGVIFALITSFITKGISNNVLKILFGVFLIILSIVEFFTLYKKHLKKSYHAKHQKH